MSAQRKRFWNGKNPLCLGSIPKYFSVNNMKKTQLNGYVYNNNNNNNYYYYYYH